MVAATGFPPGELALITSQLKSVILVACAVVGVAACSSSVNTATAVISTPVISTPASGSAPLVTSATPPATTSAPATAALAPASAAPAAAVASDPVGTGAPSTMPGPPLYAFPVAAPAKASYGPKHHDYPAADIFASCGSNVVAATSGTVDEISLTDRWTKKANDPTTRGGLSVSISGDDGVRYYASHMKSVDPSIAVGARVDVGQLLGAVGDTGDASACHVHFGVSPICGTGEWWVRRGVIWPQHYLDGWRRGVPVSPQDEVATWSSAHPTACADATAMPWPSR